jgi:hypothetical protein
MDKPRPGASNLTRSDRKVNLKKREAERRREFMKEIILRDPLLSAAKLNEFARKEFGGMIRTSTIYEMKEELGFDRLGNLRVPNQGPAAVARARNAAETNRGVFPLLISLSDAERPAEVAGRLLKRLEESGVVNLKISGSGATWIVVEPAA